MTPRVGKRVGAEKGRGGRGRVWRWQLGRNTPRQPKRTSCLLHCSHACVMIHSCSYGAPRRCGVFSNSNAEKKALSRTNPRLLRQEERH